MPIPAPISTPEKPLIVDDQCSVDTAFQWVSQGGTLIFQGSFKNARQLLSALARHIDKRQRRTSVKSPAPLQAAFHRYRQQQSQRANLLNRLLVEVLPGYQLCLKHAPDIAPACLAAFTNLEHKAPIPLRQILGALSAFEWRNKGVAIDGLKQPLHVHYGVFSPVRGEYLGLIRTAPLPQTRSAVDLGTGSGVIAALLAERGVQHIIATDTNPDALACAAENLTRMGLLHHVQLESTDDFPEGQFDLIVCNPPWLPGRPTSVLETAVYDPDSRMLKGFLKGLGKHLLPDGEGWLIMSDLAEHLGLRPEGAISQWATDAGLTLIERHTTMPSHPKASDPNNPLHQARSKEVTSLWRFRQTR